MRLSLLGRFSLISYLLMALMAMALGWGIQHQLEVNALGQAAESVSRNVATMLGPYLRVEDFDEPLSETRYREIDARIRESAVRDHVVRVKLWASSGRLVYSDEPSIVGREFAKSDELERALAGEIATDVSSLDKPENVAEKGVEGGQLLEVYVPIRLTESKAIVGANEIYEDMVSLNRRIGEMRRLVWTSVAFGFLLLYSTLFTLVRGASRDLVRQHERNAQLLTDVKAHAEELELLNTLGQEIAGSLDLRQVAHKIVAAVAHRFDGFLCGLLLYDEAGREVVTLAASGWGADRIEPGERIPLGRGIIGQAALTQRVQLANDTAADPHFVPLPGHRVRAEVALPILREGKLLGVCSRWTVPG